MYETLICEKCSNTYTNVGAIPQLCNMCWENYNKQFRKKYPNKKLHIFDY